MKTYFPKKCGEKKWYIIDAKNKILGRLAVRISDILRGKGKTFFSPHLDCGDYVIVINAAKVKVTGNKYKEKKYYSHSRYPGSLKTVSFKDMLEKKPEDIIKKAVKGMLPKNKLQKVFLQKLKVFAGEEYSHKAQNPVRLEINN